MILLSYKISENEILTNQTISKETKTIFFLSCIKPVVVIL